MSFESYRSPTTNSVTFLGSWDSSSERGIQIRRKIEECGLEVIDATVRAWPRVIFRHQRLRLSSYVHFLWAHLRNVLVLLRFALVRKEGRIVVCGFKVSYELVVLRLFRSWSGAHVIYDPYVSVVDTLVEDRKIIPEGSLRHRLLKLGERLVLRCADSVVADTEESAKMFTQSAGTDLNLVVLPVYINSHLVLEDRKVKSSGNVIRVLYFGNYVPLHGLENVVRGLALLESPFQYEFCFVGDGQERVGVEREASRIDVDISFIDPIPLQELIEVIDSYDVCLGVFGSSEKARRVVPNKVFLALARGIPVLTLESAPVRRYLDGGVFFVERPDERSISEALEQLPGELIEGASLASEEALTGSLDKRFDAHLEKLLVGSAVPEG